MLLNQASLQQLMEMDGLTLMENWSHSALMLMCCHNNLLTSVRSLLIHQVTKMNQILMIITLYTVLIVTLINLVYLHAIFIYDDEIFTWLIIMCLEKCTKCIQCFVLLA